jgi:ABC-type multidrug transport system ATPase subunit
MQNFLEAVSIRKSFGDKQVLTDIYIGCKTGDVIGLLGRNGIGKSTFFKILFGTLYTDDKHIVINGEHVTQPFKKEGAMGYLYQDNFLPKSLTVKKILNMFDDELDEPAFHADEVISKILNTRIGELSGGESRYLEVKLILSLKNNSSYSMSHLMVFHLFILT